MPFAISHTKRIALAALLALAPGCGVQQFRTYAGEPRLPTEVGIIHSNAIYITRVDGQLLNRSDDFNGSARRQAVEVLPGRHRLTVGYSETQGNVIRYGVNLFTLSHNFEAGKTYSFRVTQQSLGSSSIWLPQLIDEKSGNVLAKMEVKPDAPARSAPGTATLRGRAAAGAHLATGHDVVLIKKNKRTDDWVYAWRRWAGGYGVITEAFNPSPFEVEETKSPLKRTLGYGLGFFEFRDVPPGEYYVIFRGSGKGFGDLPVTVKPGETLRDELLVVQHEPDGTIRGIATPP